MSTDSSVRVWFRMRVDRNRRRLGRDKRFRRRPRRGNSAVSAAIWETGKNTGLDFLRNPILLSDALCLPFLPLPVCNRPSLLPSQPLPHLPHGPVFCSSLSTHRSPLTIPVIIARTVQMQWLSEWNFVRGLNTGIGGKNFLPI